LFLELREDAGNSAKDPFAFGKIGRQRSDFSGGTDLSAKENLEMKLKMDEGSGKWQDHCDQWSVIK
jgi:hypothetical protein